MPEYDRERLIVEVRTLASSELFLLNGWEFLTLQVLLSFVLRRDGFEIDRFALLFEVGDDLLDFAVGHERPVHARDPPAPRHVEHVALPQQLLRPHLAQDRATVDLARDLKRDPGR